MYYETAASAYQDQSAPQGTCRVMHCGRPVVTERVTYSYYGPDLTGHYCGTHSL